MKNILFTIAAFLPILAIAQTNNFTISGKIGGLNQPVKIHLDYGSNGAVHTDSTVLINGTFSFAGHIDDVSEARLTLDHTGEGKQASIYKGGDNIYFFFAKENMVINSNDSLINAHVTGSKFYDEYAAYNKKIGGSIMEIDKIANDKFNSGTPEQQKDTNFKKAIDTWFYKKLGDRTEAQIQFARDNPHSFFAVVALLQELGAKISWEQMESIYNAIDEKWRMTSSGQDMAKRIKAFHTIVVGDQAPAFTLNNTNGKPVSLADLKGKILLIDFWASWCEPCRAESPNLKEQYKLYKDKGFEIISVSLDTDRKNWLKAIKDDGLPWLQVSDLKGYNSETIKTYGIHAIPSFLLIDRDGKIIANTDVRGASLNARLAALFNN